MWYDPNLPPTDPTSYRLPVGDVINGDLTLIYHAIYAAAALLSGAHGGLPGIDEADRADLRNVISEIYPEMAREFNDASIRAPWDRSAQPGVQMSADTYAATEPYGDVKYADPGYRDNRKRYPIDTPDHIRAAWSYINMPKNQTDYTDEQVEAIKGRIKAAAKKAGIEISDSEMSANGSNMRKKKRRRDENGEYSMTMYPVEPPAAWFSKPELPSRTPLTVTPEGQVFGHIAAWGECHRDFAGRECVLAPKSRKGYEPFHLGTVYTAEGDPVRVGKIVMDTRHADISLGYTAAAIHYDNTGDEAAVIRASDGNFGVWVAGAVVPEMTPAKVAKLRRSPISGDWRRVGDNLELTAALAVNVPAFPVYAMDGEDQLALVAAGTLEPAKVQEPPTGVTPDLDLGRFIRETVEQVFATIQDDQAQQERAERLADLLEDEQIYAERARMERFSALTAAAQPPEPAPSSTVASPPVTPEQMDARFSIIEEPAGGAEVVPGADRQQTTPPAGATSPTESEVQQ
jgi:hypothetical protein